jgi:ferric-dicitrate binding protein FerR (iron transport regulator)
MQNNSIDTLLLRHYGSRAVVPDRLEERLRASVRQKQDAATYLRARRVGRRRAVHLVALGAAGASALGIGMDCLHMLEAGLLGQDAMQTAMP